MTMDTLIPDRLVYLERLSKPLIDKLFFLDKTDASLFVDYGCADGALLRTMKMLFPEYRYVGFDASAEMLEVAHGHGDDGIAYFDDWNALEQHCLGHQGRTCLILSSIIHEVYEYQSQQEIKQFWQRVWSTEDSAFQFDYVASRDMMTHAATSRPSDPLSVARIRQLYDPDKLHEWERQWGSLNENWSLLHFLLTYRYTENWARELRENYLPLTMEAYLRLIPRRYTPIYIEHFMPPFLRRQVMTDFGIAVPDPTHLKLIVSLERGEP